MNALVHRQYEDAGRKILLEVFPDKVVVSSPGLPPAPITLAALRTGKYRPCSRNPVLAQCLSYFHHIEERGSGFRRMRDRMLDHGLDAPILTTDSGYFQVTLLGPGEDVERLRTPEEMTFSPAVMTRLSDRQRVILEHVVESGDVTTRWCIERFAVARDTAHRDLTGMVALRLLVPTGSGRSAKYILGTVDDS